MAEVIKSPRRVYSVLRNLELAFPVATLAAVSVARLWSSDISAGIVLASVVVAFALGLLCPFRVDGSLGKWRIWLVMLFSPFALLHVAVGVEAVLHCSFVFPSSVTNRFQLMIADADRVEMRDHRDRVVYVTTNQCEIAGFGDRFRFSESTEPCGCFGCPWVYWRKGDACLAVASVHHGTTLSVRGGFGSHRLSLYSFLSLSSWINKHCGFKLGDELGFSAAAEEEGPVMLEAVAEVNASTNAAAESGQIGVQAEAIALAGVPNLHKVSDKLYRSAQPTAEGMTNIVALGIKTVVNLRDNHSDSDEIGDLPLKARRIEIFTANMKDKYVDEFLSIVDDTNAVPILVHCQHGADRTGTMCAMYRILREGWTADDAIDEMKNGGFGYHSVWGNLPRFIRKSAEKRAKANADGGQ